MKSILPDNKVKFEEFKEQSYFRLFLKRESAHLFVLCLTTLLNFILFISLIHAGTESNFAIVISVFFSLAVGFYFVYKWSKIEYSYFHFHRALLIAKSRILGAFEFSYSQINRKGESRVENIDSIYVHPSSAVKICKRLIDIAFGLVGTLVFLFSYPLLALLIKFESPGPAIYRQSRVGLDRRNKNQHRLKSATNIIDTPTLNGERRLINFGGRVFTIYKFRTMRIDAERNGPQLARKFGDPRVTKIGSILRKLHIDELPQFLNVLMGDMSFIGPRSERPHFTVQYAKIIPSYLMRTQNVKPGITGLSQVVFGEIDDLMGIVRKHQFDSAYIASLARFSHWIRTELWVLANVFMYYATGKPIQSVQSLSHYFGPSSIIAEQKKSFPSIISSLIAKQPSSQVDINKFDGIRVFPNNPLRISNFLTVNVECWFHAHNLNIPKSTWDRQPTKVVENVRRILDLLKSSGSKATFFTLGYVADRFPEVVRMIDEDGHEIGTYGYMHDNVTDMTPYEFEKDLERSLNALSKRYSRRITGHRTSNFSIVKGTLWALDILTRYGIEYDSSIYPVERDRYGIPDYPNRMPHTINLGSGKSIREIPLSTLSIGNKALPMSGGGYLRLYPYAVTDLFIRRRNNQGLPAMVYFHPWEIDNTQARIKAGLIKRFQHYVNLDTTEWKISRLLNSFQFLSIEENLEQETIQTLLRKNPVFIAKSKSIEKIYTTLNTSENYQSSDQLKFDKYFPVEFRDMEKKGISISEPLFDRLQEPFIDQLRA